MTSTDLRADLRSRNIFLEVEDGRLICDAPIGAIKPEDLVELRAHKAELLAILAGSGSPIETPRPLPWRPIVGQWPIELRQRWGDRSNELEDDGHSWREAERIVFEELNEEAHLPPGRSKSSTDTEGLNPAWTFDRSLTVPLSSVRESIADCEQARSLGL